MKYGQKLLVSALALGLGLLMTSLVTSGCGSDDSESGATIAGVDGGTDGADSGGDTTGDDGAGDTGGEPAVTEPQDLCTPCDTDEQCGPGRSCVPDARGNGFCSRECGYFGDSACTDDYYCKQLGTTSADFFCWPLNGVCEVDGDDCSPCRPTGSDCNEGLSCFEPLGDIAFCVRPCEGTGTCPHPGMECGHHEDLEGSVCLPRINGVPTAKCGARPLEFCEPCTTAGQCATGVCVDSPNIGMVCSQPCDSDVDCPSGTDCVHEACVPPIAHGCQGFLSCLGVDCQSDEICHRGFCRLAP